jgi:alkylhydroperoxidase family enzyme
MPWIKVFAYEEATGFLKQQYDAAIKRAGRIWNIVSIMSQNPRVLKASMDMYGAVMHAESPLSRGQRELLATVVSSENGCHY